MSKENTTEYIVLGLLMHEDLSGYDLKKHIDQSISQFWEVGYGQLYPTLKELEQAGYISGRHSGCACRPKRNTSSTKSCSRFSLVGCCRRPRR
jgi:DNA-binding PadR family transcriptional regulator